MKQLKNSENPRLLYWDYQHFSFNNILQDQRKAQFRFGLDFRILRYLQFISKKLLPNSHSH